MLGLRRLSIQMSSGTNSSRILEFTYVHELTHEYEMLGYDFAACVGLEPTLLQIDGSLHSTTQ
jgi:hypothetical protein